MNSSCTNPGPRLTEQVLVALRRIMRATDLHSRKLFRQFGLTAPQLVVLREIAVRGELSCTALAAAASMSLPTATGIVNRLEARGLVVRRRSRSDKRQVLLSTTDAGRQVLESAPLPLQKRFTKQFGALREWEQTQILSVLQRIVAMMEAESLDASPVLSADELVVPEAGDDSQHAAGMHLSGRKPLTEASS